MTTIARATLNDIELLTQIGKTSFLEAHGRSASEEQINEYVSKNLTNKTFEEALKDINNIFHIIYYNEKAVGYSKIIFNSQHPNIPFNNATKLERLYLLEEFHSLKLGFELFNFNKNEAIKYNQSVMWLFVWTENLKAINFYKKAGFKIVGQHDFQITATHSNPNHQMLLTF
ncbi:MAG: GNAT family N-acetyltransferase [Flavobacteriaceae bacterium]|jgi:diamine N-acetyltransferase|nr:GNAT family N-acetyltransferase [Flavobacteriaceae bacterium]